MGKILLLIGPTCSGKTTFAEKYCRENKAYYVSRDAERESLFVDYRMGSLKEENLITNLIKYKVGLFLQSGDVVLDNTHLRSEYIQNVINDFPNTNIEFLVFGKDLEKSQLIKRNQTRFFDTGKLIGEGVLNKQIKLLSELEIPENINRGGVKYDPRISNKYNREDQTKLPNCFIFDLDGCIAWMNGRSAYDGGACSTDLPDPVLTELMRLLSTAGAQIFIFSGRNSDKGGREATEKWLEDYDIPYDELVMRKEGDLRSDVKVKNDMFNEHIEGKYYPAACFDDRDCMVEYYRNKGIQTYQCYYGNF